MFPFHRDEKEKTIATSETYCGRLRKSGATDIKLISYSTLFATN